MSDLERAKKHLDMIPEELRGNPNDLVRLLEAMVAKVEELKEFIEDQNRVIRVQVNHDDIMGSATQQLAEAQAKVEELEYKRNEAIAIAEREVILRKKLQAKVEELQGELRTIYNIVGASNNAEEMIKRIDAKYPALKQEGE